MPKPCIILNAEAFGFGPTAAIAAIFPYLRPHCDSLAYLGAGHTLDLQRTLPYDEMYDISIMQPAMRQQLLATLAHRYDTFFTALDFEMASVAYHAGLPIAIYDPLTWYWPTVPPIARNAALYAAQNFFGVQERLKAESELFASAHLVPPLVPDKKPSGQRKYVVLNLGGLQNPFWELRDAVTYARAAITAVRRSLPAGERLIVATSAAVANELNDTARPYSRTEMLSILACTKYACMTPGLGNIYDAAYCNVPTLWLPPANDSQGRQALLLTEHDACDGYVDWAAIGVPIAYAAPQGGVLAAITKAVHRLENSPSMSAAYNEAIAAGLQSVQRYVTSKSTQLMNEFGSGGTPYTASLLLDVATKRSRA